MDFQGLWKERKDEIIIFILFIILPVIYFGSLLTPQKMIYGSDWLMTGYPRLKWAFDYIKLNHRLPMWDPCIFCGHPTIAATGGGIVYPLNLIYFIFPVHVGRTITFIIHIFLAGLGMWLLLREYKLSHLASLIGGIAFMFAGQLISTTHGGHLGRMIGAVILPWSFLFLHKALNNRSIVYFLVFGGVTGIFLLGGHVQITYWAMIGVFFYFIYEIVRRRKEIELKELSKLAAFSIMGAVLAAFIVAVKLLPPAFCMGYCARGVTRGYEYATSWSIPTSELFNIIVPHFSGILGNYWGENFFKLDSRYLGILPLILLGLSFLYKKNRYLIKFFAWFIGITLFLALGKNTPLFRIYYWLVPMANKFRAPSMFFFLTTFGIAVLSGFGAQVVMDLSGKKNEETEKKAFIFVICTVGAILLSTIIINLGDVSILQSMKSHFGNVWMGIGMDRRTIQEKLFLIGQNFGNFKKSLWISSFLFIINGGLILAVIKRRLDLKIVIPVLALVLLIDQWSIDRKYLSSVAAPSSHYKADGVTRYIKKDNGVFRVCPDRYEKGNSGYLQYNNIKTVSGLGANPPKRYQDFIGAGRSVMFTTKNFLKYPHLLSMLNVKYIVGPNLPEDLSGYNMQVKKIVEELRDFFSNFNVVFRDREYQVLENESFLPRFSLIYSCSMADSAEDILNKILSDGFNPGKVALLEDSLDFSLKEGKGKLSVVKNIANERVLDVTTDKDAFLIVRENSHPDWKCYIDGKSEKIYKANYIFYGVFVPAGKHTVRFVYESRVFNIAALLSFMGFIMFLGLSLVVYVKQK
jgi:hypothetical protein